MEADRTQTRAILELAGRQYGVVSRRQLMDRGIPARSVTNRTSQISLFPVFRPVFMVGNPFLTMNGARMAALLAAGDGAALGFRSAAKLWGFLDHRNPIEVLRTQGGTSQRARIRVAGETWWPYLLVRKPRALPPSDLTTKLGLALTSPERTLRDLAQLLPEQQFFRAFTEADRLELLNEGALRSVAERTRGSRGGRMFRQAVSRRIPNVKETESLLEAIVLKLTLDGRIPPPEINRKTRKYRPDFRWPVQRVIVEADGYEFHRGREMFEQDISRANRLRRDGWTVLRFTWRMVDERPDEVAEIIAEVLAEAGSRAK
ncbi:MAG: endonuclease domain-containing protein [Solirubrobacterales bacterium]